MRTCRRPSAAGRRAAAALGLALLAAEAARAETLVTSISSSRVEITSNYTGGTIAVFGAVERDGQTIARTGGYDVVVTAKGPRQNLTVREKEPVGPLWLNREQQQVVDYLEEENRVLREPLGGRRPRFTDDQRRRLAAKARKLGRGVLREMNTLVTPDTLLRWHRQLIARKYDGSANRGTGRPGVMEETGALVVRTDSNM